MTTAKTRELEEALSRLFPINVKAHVFIHIIQADGGIIPGCVAAVTCALTSGGVGVPFILSGCQLGDGGGGELLVDTTAAEEHKARSMGSCTVSIVLRWDSTIRPGTEATVCGVWMDGKMANPELLERFESAAVVPATQLFQLTCDQQRHYLEGQK